jgi:protein-S-isoprenylcysteine O-methyltransferase Ste14
LNGDTLFRVLFFIMWLVFIAYLLWKEYSTRESTEKFSICRHVKQATQREGKARIIGRAILAPFWFLGFVVYAIYPDMMTTFSFPLPDWLRWVMVAVSIVTIPSMMWGYHALGKAWTPPKLLLRKEHVLVTSGPYHYVRHPIYAAGFTFMVTLAMATANWLVLLPMLAGTALLYAQVGREEAILIDRFGDEYRQYMKRTRRFLPRLEARE